MVDRRTSVIEVNVTQEHIDIARQSLDPTGSIHNLVARAICEALGEPVGQVSTKASIGSITHKSGKVVTLPDEALKKLRRWLRFREIETFSFTVDL